MWYCILLSNGKLVYLFAANKAEAKLKAVEGTRLRVLKIDKTTLYEAKGFVMSEQSRYYLNHNVRSMHKKNKTYLKICDKCGYMWESKGPNASCPQCKGGK